MVVVLARARLPVLSAGAGRGGGGGVTHAGVQAGSLVSQGQRAVWVGQIVEEDPASHGQPHRAHAGVSEAGALQ